MVLPVLILAAIGYVLRHRGGAILVPPEPFRLTLDKIHFAPVTPHEAYEGYDTKVVVDLGHRGTAPKWWSKPEDYIMGTTTGHWQLLAGQGDMSVNAYDAKGVAVQPFRWQATYDKDTDKYSARYLMKLRQISPGDELRLQDHLRVESTSVSIPCAPVWVDTVVRQKGQRTTLPQVSHATGLKVERVEIDAASPTSIQSTTSQGRAWRARFLMRSTGQDSYGRGIGLKLQVVDEHGNAVRASYGMASPEGSWSDISAGADTSRLTTVTYSFGLDTKHLAPTQSLRLKGIAYSGDYWPLFLDLPLRDGRGKMLLTPRPAPAFRVTSATKGVPTPSEAKIYGIDTLVTAPLQAIGTPTNPLDQWEWETNYASYVADARGKCYWVFPFKSGTHTAPATLNMTPVGSAKSFQIIYSLNLSAIPASAGALTFHATISANGSQRVPIAVRVR